MFLRPRFSDFFYPTSSLPHLNPLRYPLLSRPRFLFLTGRRLRIPSRQDRLYKHLIDPDIHIIRSNLSASSYCALYPVFGFTFAVCMLTCSFTHGYLLSPLSPYTGRFRSHALVSCDDMCFEFPFPCSTFMVLPGPVT